MLRIPMGSQVSDFVGRPDIAIVISSRRMSRSFRVE